MNDKTGGRGAGRRLALGRVVMALAGASLAGCGGEADVVVMGAADAGPAEVALAPARVPPRLEVTAPDRGAWFGSDDMVSVSGSASGETAALAAVKVQKEPVAHKNGSFDVVLAPQNGINILGVRAEDQDGERTVDGRSYFWGEVHPTGEVLAHAVVAHLSPAFLDDDDPDLDDIASVVELLVTDPSVLATFNLPLDLDGLATLTPTQISMDQVAVDIVPTDQGLALTIHVTGLSVAFLLDGEGGLGDLLSGPGTMTASQLTAGMVLSLSVQDGLVVGDVVEGSVVVTVDGFDLKHELLDSLGSFAPKVVDFARDYVLETFQGLLTEQVGPLIGQFLQGFAYEASFGTDPVMDMVIALDGAEVDPLGLTITLSAAVSTTLGKGVPFGPQYGSLKSVTTPPPSVFSEEPVAFAIDDDLINLFLFNYWYGGALSGIDVAPGDFEADLSNLPAVFQPLTRVKVDTLLPTVVTPRELDDDDLPYEISLGEMHLTLMTGAGKRFSCSLNARTGVDIRLDEATNAILMVADTRPKTMQIEVGCYDVPPELDPGSVASLLRLGLPPLLRTFTDAFKFEMPGLALSRFVTLDALTNLELAFPHLSSRIMGPERNLFVLEGAPVLRQVAPR